VFVPPPASTPSRALCVCTRRRHVARSGTSTVPAELGNYSAAFPLGPGTAMSLVFYHRSITSYSRAPASTMASRSPAGPGRTSTPTLRPLTAGYGRGILLAITSNAMLRLVSIGARPFEGCEPTVHQQAPHHTTGARVPWFVAVASASHPFLE